MKHRLKALKQWIRYQQLPSSAPTGAAAAPGQGTCVIPPSDPGSLGDEAMMVAVADRYAAGGMDVVRWQRATQAVYPGTREAIGIAELGRGRAEATLQRYGRLACLGADIMDGLYAYAQSCQRLRLLGLAAAMGRESRLLGFSFNARPHPRVVEEFARLHRDVVVCVRDPVSLRRLAAITDRELRLVADMAFLVRPVKPGGLAADIQSWASDVRRRGRRVIGLNLHPLFSFEHGSGITRGLIDAFLELIRRHRDVAFVLVPHDHRPLFGDGPCLRAVWDGLAPADRERVRMTADLRRPAEVKGFVGALDGVLTGRMHLAIAALGQGVPAAGVTYQGKFEGLLQHFEMGEGLTIAPPQAADPDRLAAFFAAWLNRLDVLATEVRARLPHVQELATRNFR